ncbi:hypothetical protein [Streptosporangium roseum]|uniref:SGNH hydrolase-type esterase domain-containing protein n=1 Tax=Streptosporangium roseum (strain ATCC 12428 / DSM 43021 / JCM 3005 / KCTC 9067 / NCIMB 10171 / NRRL 2505 / NI 9100) TaxID=479432 RepID=D2AS37_STRRD|nr:hypothetical protein [Streptosporangium roseum]ACZ86564.1 hypothetical protein Sros_3633 [Streptosporangium roseum DSM 43021]
MTTAWTAAFRSAPVSAYESMTLIYPSRAFRDQTLRQIVRLRGSGDRLRVRLSNRYGKQPLTVARTHVAAHDTRSSITPDTDAVSRTHLTGAEEVEPRFYLSGIDIEAPEGRHVVAAFGDSLTDGVGTAHGAHELIAGPASITRQARRAGLTALVATVSPFGGADGVSPGFDDAGPHSRINHAPPLAAGVPASIPRSPRYEGRLSHNMNDFTRGWGHISCLPWPIAA